MSRNLSSEWRCECGARNQLNGMPAWPNVPTSLYIGPDKHARLKVYAVPPETQDQDWAQPYSIRSFAYQASEKFGECAYRPSRRGMVMGEPVFSDQCYASAHDADYEQYAVPHECHLVTGWTTGQDTCGLWQRIEALCQTDPERRFLKTYLGYVKDREFPMLIPQAWLGHHWVSPAHHSAPRNPHSPNPSAWPRRSAENRDPARFRRHPGAEPRS